MRVVEVVQCSPADLGDRRPAISWRQSTASRCVDDVVRTRGEARIGRMVAVDLLGEGVMAGHGVVPGERPAE